MLTAKRWVHSWAATGISSMRTIHALPCPFTFDPQRTALVRIDMQRDFIEPGGFGAALGNDVSLLAPVVPAAAKLVAWARRTGVLVVHTRECHRPDLSECPDAKRLRGKAEPAHWRSWADGSHIDRWRTGS